MARNHHKIEASIPASKVLSLDAGVCALIIQLIKPIHAAIMKELERDDLPDLMRETLTKKRLSFETLFNVLRGQSTKKAYDKRVYRTGQLHENEVDIDEYLLVADGPDGELEVIETDAQELGQEEERLQDAGYLTTRYRVVPELGREIALFWPVLGEELVEWFEKDAEIQAWRADNHTTST